MWHQSAHRQALHKQVASAAFSLTCLVCGAKLVQTVGMNKKKRAAMHFLRPPNLLTSCLFCHICCAVAQSVGVDHRSAPFARHPVRAERTRRFSMLYAFVSRRKALLLVVHGRVPRCPRPCATLFVAVCNVAHAHGQRARPVSEMDFPSLQTTSCLVRTISPLLIHSTHRSVGTGRGRVCRACTRRR